MRIRARAAVLLAAASLAAAGTVVAAPVPASASGLVWVRLVAAEEGYPDTLCSLQSDQAWSNGHCDPSSGVLYAGRNYVYCKAWGGSYAATAGVYNHWWLKTDLDRVYPGMHNPAWVSALHLGGAANANNDTAFDENGHEIPNC